ncbi:DUF4229 domain-containing protein [Luethyella okanaganae]|uniref:DUF4229 domain-containing protein n=1 Tax=Luethyella okanaganae TaxID=69372 RepID=A0ABW1VH66_9MICO
MKAPSWLTYTIPRVLAFAVPLTLLLLVNVNPWISALLAAVIGLCVSYIFLRRPRETVSRELYERRHGDNPTINVDDESEDAAIDNADIAKSSADTPTLPDASTAGPDPADSNPANSNPADSAAIGTATIRPAGGDPAAPSTPSSEREGGTEPHAEGERGETAQPEGENKLL